MTINAIITIHDLLRSEHEKARIIREMSWNTCQDLRESESPRAFDLRKAKEAYDAADEKLDRISRALSEFMEKRWN